MIGERYDGDAGLQYLNARYYDPKLAMFIKPDWWEVTKAGVGTNRYAYSFDDPVNPKDPSGHVNVKDAARLSDAAYTKGKSVTGFERLDKKALEKIGLGKTVFENKKTGLQSSLFRNKATNEYTLAYAGTKRGDSWHEKCLGFC